MRGVRKNRRWVFILSAVLLCAGVFLAAGFDAAALTDAEFEEMVNSQLDEIGAGGITDSLDAETAAVLEKLGVSGVYSSDMLEFYPKNYLKLAGELSRQTLPGALGFVLTVCGALMIAAVVRGIGSDGSPLTGISKAKDYFCTAAIAVAVSAPMVSLVNESGRIAELLKVTLAAFIPVFSTAVAGSGQPVAASVSAAGLFTVSQLSVWAVIETIIPLCSVFLAFGITASLTPSLNLSGVTSGMKKLVVWLLGAITVIFTAVLSLKTVLAQSADTVSLRALKLLVSGGVPIVGGGLSDAMATIMSCLSTLKTAVGFFGVAAIFALFLPYIIKLAVWRLAVAVCRAAAAALGLEQQGKVLSAAADLLAILMAVFVFIAFALVIMITVVMQSGAV